MWNPKAYEINVLIVIDANLNLGYLASSNVIWKQM